MNYIIGIIIFIIGLSFLWEIAKQLIGFLLGLAILAGIIFLLIHWGPVIIMGLFSLISSIFPYLLYIVGGLLVLGLIISIGSTMKSFFVKYPWQATVIFITIISLGVIVFVKIGA